MPAYVPTNLQSPVVAKPCRSGPRASASPWLHSSWGSAVCFVPQKCESQDLDERAARWPTGILSYLSKLIILTDFMSFNESINRITELRLSLPLCDQCKKYSHKPLKGMCALVFRKSRLLLGSLSSLML